MEVGSSKFPNIALERRSVLILALAVSISISVYLVASAMIYRIGFPLDDAWIHQTYARNLALSGEWAFSPGHPSDGSTSPLWTGLIAIGYWLRLGPYIWTFFLGGLILLTLALLGEWVVRRMLSAYHPTLPWMGLFLAGEWHLVWAAVSGMETLLSAFLVTSVLGLLLTKTRRYLAFGLLVGLSVWVRPDGITLLGPVALTILLEMESWQRLFSNLLKFGIGFGALFAPYLLFNLVLTGAPWPNTFYAKQAEYAALLSQPVGKRFLEQLLLPLTGAGIILLPGVIVLALVSVREKSWGLLAGMVWFLGFLTMYALSLPVTYQHGRYIIPAMPIYFIWGVEAFVLWSQSKSHVGYHSLVDKIWRVSMVTVLLIFWLLGARAYGQDVAVIESEMVQTACWVAQNVPSNALVAVHDIGAMGYFGRHRLVDLAGLVSPEVIPFIRDESRLEVYLDQRGVQYLVTFPGWYPQMVQNGELLFTTSGAFAPTFGSGNMAVYRWRSTP
jgi:hypothetical protein